MGGRNTMPFGWKLCLAAAAVVVAVRGTTRGASESYRATMPKESNSTNNNYRQHRTTDVIHRLIHSLQTDDKGEATIRRSPSSLHDVTLIDDDDSEEPNFAKTSRKLADDDKIENNYARWYEYNNDDREQLLVTMDDDLRATNDDPVALDDDPTYQYLTYPPTASASPEPTVPEMIPGTAPPTELPTLFWYEPDGFMTDDDLGEQLTDSPNPVPNESERVVDRPVNSVLSHISLGIVHNEKLVESDKVYIMGICLRTMTLVLNNYGKDENGNGGLPFVVSDEAAFAEFQYRGRHLEQATTAVAGPQPVRLVLHNVTATLPNQLWWQTTAIYTVWRVPATEPSESEDIPTNTRRNLDVSEDATMYSRPIDSPRVLKRIETLCDRVISHAIKTGYFWDTLQTVDFRNKTLVLKNRPYFPYDKGVADVRNVGSEYDLRQWYCPRRAAQNVKSGNVSTNCGLCCEAVLGEPPVSGAEGSFPNKDTDDPSSLFPNTGVGSNRGEVDDSVDAVLSNQFTPGTYALPIAETPLEVEWKIREWAGLGMMAGTLLVVLLMSLVSHLVNQRRAQQQLWGAALTQEGVDDILQVGWRYHEQFYALSPQEQQQIQQQQQGSGEQPPQVFLQIYDKGKGPGYSDENSMLKGGIEQAAAFHNYATPSTAHTTSTATPHAYTQHHPHQHLYQPNNDIAATVGYPESPQQEY